MDKLFNLIANNIKIFDDKIIRRFSVFIAIFMLNGLFCYIHNSSTEELLLRQILSIVGLIYICGKGNI